MQKYFLPQAFFRKKSQQGISTLILILLLSLIGTLVIVTIQSRLLLAIHRNESASDVLISLYSAESKTNDSIAKYYGHYIDDLILDTEDLENDTEVKTKGVEQEDGSTKLTVTATRPYAISQVEAIKRDITQTAYDRVEIVLALDCTSSMNRAADPADPSSQTSFEAEAQAAIDFVEGAKTLDSPLVTFRIGILVFGVDAKWLTFNKDGLQEVRPDNNNLNFTDIQAAIDLGFNDTKNNSPACNSIIDATSIGSGYAYAHEYFKTKDLTSVKGIEVVITDGEPNSRMPYPDCPAVGFTPTTFCPGFPKDPVTNQNYCYTNDYGWSCYEGSTYRDGPFDADYYNFNELAYTTCAPLGQDFLKCAIADTANSYLTADGYTYQGVRNPEIDSYALTIFADPPPEIVEIFNSYLTPNGYYNATQASNLPEKLNEILTSIINNFTTITIRRLVP